MRRLVQGIGVNDNKNLTLKDGKLTEEYKLWSNMLFRCTKKFWIKHPTYIGVTCSENFKSYAFFYEWCQGQIGFGNTGVGSRRWNLDKDLLVKGNKLYSEAVCVFVPQRVNLLLTKRDASRGEWPIGVHVDEQGKFRSQCSKGKGKKKNLGGFDTAQEAFEAYKTFKESLIKEVANEYKGLLDSRVYAALMVYKVNAND